MASCLFGLSASSSEKARIAKSGSCGNGRKQKILLHVCCGPCSTYCISRLSQSYEVHAFFYNPNIHPQHEYSLRKDEFVRFCKSKGIPYYIGKYEPERWFAWAKEFKHLPEKSIRCSKCFVMRLFETALLAKKLGIGLFTTTLSISPFKSYEQIKNAAEQCADGSVSFVDIDFKKKDGFKRSIELGKKHNMRRQTYCGCAYSFYEMIKRRKGKKER